MNRGSNANNVIYKGVLFLLFFGLYALNVGSTFSSNNLPFLVILALSMMVALIIFFSKIRYIRIEKSLLYYFCFVLIALLSYFWATSKEIAFTGALVVALTFVVINVFYFIVCEANIDIYDIFRLILLAALFTYLYLIAKYGISITWSLRSADFRDSDLYNANSVGRIYIIGAICGLIEAKNKSNSSIIKICSMWLLMLSLLTGSKTVVLLGAVFLITVLYIDKRGKEKAFLIILLPVLALVGYYAVMNIPFLYNIIGNRFSELFDMFNGELEKYSSTWYRFAMMQNGIELFVAKPLLGYGMANASVYNAFEWAYESGVYLHSNILELLVDVGVLGTTFYYAIYVHSLKLNIKRAINGDLVSKYFVGFVVAFWVTDISAVSYFSRPTILFIVLSALYANDMLKMSKKSVKYGSMNSEVI